MMNIQEHLHNELLKIQEQSEQSKLDVIKRKLEDEGFSEELLKPSRFPKITQEIKGNETTIWVDDGTNEGFRLVTFVDKIEYYTKDNQYKAIVETTYY